MQKIQNTDRIQMDTEIIENTENTDRIQIEYRRYRKYR